MKIVWFIQQLPVDIDIIHYIKQIYIDKSFKLIRPPMINIAHSNDILNYYGYDFTVNGDIKFGYSYDECRLEHLGIVDPFSTGDHCYRISYWYRIPGHVSSITTYIDGDLEPFLNYRIQYISHWNLYDTKSIKERRFYFIEGDGMFLLKID